MISVKLKNIVLYLLFYLVLSIPANEVVFQNGLNGYDGCKDALITTSTTFVNMDTKHYPNNGGWFEGNTEANYDSIPFLMSHLCPS